MTLQAKIVFWGEPIGALHILHNVPQVILCGLITNHARGVGDRRLRSSLKANKITIPRWSKRDLNSPDTLDQISNLKPDLHVAAFYSDLIPSSLLSDTSGIGVHPSDLPRWRGDDPAYWTIRSGERESACCVHLLDDTFNGGPVLRRKKLTVGARESGGAFTSRLEKICLQLLSETLQSIFTSPRGLQSELNSALPQEGQVSWAPLIAPDELEIDWSRSNAEVDAFIRAAAPYPCAFTGLGRELLVVHRGRPVDMPQHPVIPYGQALVVDQRCLIQCGDGYYELLEITAGRRRMKGRELALLLGGKS